MEFPNFFVFDESFFYALSGTRWPLVIRTFSNRQALVPPHSHAFFELVVVISGHGTYMDDEGEHYHLSPGCVLLLKPGMIHGYVEQQQLTATNILWLPEQLDMRLYDLTECPGYHALFELEPESRKHYRMRGSLELSASQLAEVMVLLQHLQYEQQQAQPGGLLASIGIFSQLLVLLCRCYRESGSEVKQEFLRMEKVLAFVRKNYHAPVSRAQLARLVSMSEVTFSRKFQRMMGCTPSEYLLNIRFLQVEKMLRITSENLSTVALRCGFSDGNHLSHMFKKRYGETPRQFRLRCAAEMKITGES